MLDNTHNITNKDLLLENSHVNSSLAYKENDLLDEVQNIKIKVLNDILGFYIKYPTLHKIYLTWYDRVYGRSHEGWNVHLSQIAWDTVINTKETKEYQESNLNIYAFCNNNIKYEENIIPYGNNQFTSYNKIKNELENKFNYLLEDKELGVKFKDEINKNITDISKKNSIAIATYNWDGFKNFEFEKEVKNFLGKDILNILFYANLNENIKEKRINFIKRKI